MPTCKTCNQDKPIEDFAKDCSRATGYKLHCKACRATKARANRKASPEHYRSIQRKSYSKNIEARREYDRQRHANNKIKRSERMAQYYKDNEQQIKQRRKSPERRLKSRVSSAKRRARLREAGGSHTYSDILHIYKAQKGHCYWCNKKVNDTYHVDHVIPVSRGGTNGIENLVIACPRCNESKHDKLPHEWEGSHGKML